MAASARHFQSRATTNPRKRFTVTLGNGSAHLELESFAGTIALRRPGEPRPETERRRPRERDPRHDEHAAAPIDGAVHEALMEVEQALPEMLPHVLAAAQ